MKIEVPPAIRAWLVRKPKISLAKPTVCADWDRQEIRYALVVARAKSCQLLAAGTLERSVDVEPLQQLAEHLRQAKQPVHQAVIVLARSDLELITLNLPPVDESEVPLMIESEIVQRLGDSDASPVADFLSSPMLEEGQSREVMAFSLTASQIEGWQTQARNARLRLVAITSRHLAPLALLRAQGLLTYPRSVAISFYAGEVEIVVCSMEIPRFLRTIRTGSDDPGTLAEQIGLEIQRSLSLLHETDSSTSLEIFLFQSPNTPALIVEALRERKFGTIHAVDAARPWSDTSIDREVQNDQLGEAALGAAWDFLHESLPINLLDPKRPPIPAHPARRWATMATAAALAVTVGGYVLHGDVRELRSEAEQLEQEAGEKERMANKLLEKADEVDLVDQWMSDRVHWLEELRELSQRIPNGQNATVRRLSAAANQDGGRFDLAVQVRQPDHITELEDQLRSARFEVSSERVSQQPSEDEFPWQFDTQIRFPLRPQTEESFVPPAADGDLDSPPEASEADHVDARSEAEVEEPLP